MCEATPWCFNAFDKYGGHSPLVIRTVSFACVVFELRKNSKKATWTKVDGLIMLNLLDRKLIKFTGYSQKSRSRLSRLQENQAA